MKDAEERWKHYGWLVHKIAYDTKDQSHENILERADKIAGKWLEGADWVSTFANMVPGVSYSSATAAGPRPSPYRFHPDFRKVIPAFRPNWKMVPGKGFYHNDEHAGYGWQNWNHPQLGIRNNSIRNWYRDNVPHRLSRLFRRRVKVRPEDSSPLLDEAEAAHNEVELRYDRNDPAGSARRRIILPPEHGSLVAQRVPKPSAARTAAARSAADSFGRYWNVIRSGVKGLAAKYVGRDKPHVRNTARSDDQVPYVSHGYDQPALGQPPVLPDDLPSSRQRPAVLDDESPKAVLLPAVKSVREESFEDGLRLRKQMVAERGADPIYGHKYYSILKEAEDDLDDDPAFHIKKQ